MTLSSDHCPNCGAPVSIRSGDRAIRCSHCGSDLRIMPDGTPVPFFHTAAQHEPEIDLTEIRRELAAGRKINAIKLVREQTSLSLKEALDYVESLERGEAPPAIPAELPAPPPAGDELYEVRDLIASGQKIEAIKRYREIHDTSLAEAKAAVEALERGEQIPAFQPPRAAPRPGRKIEMKGVPMAPSGGGCGRIILGIVVFFGLMLAGCGQFVRTTEMHACVIHAAANDPDLREALGSPIELSGLLLVMGYSSETDFGGNTDRSAGYFVSAEGSLDRAWLYVEAYEASSGFYGVRINPVPNPDDIFISTSGQVSECPQP